MMVTVTNAQREERFDLGRVARFARRAARRLRLRGRGTLSIVFVDSRRIRALNKRFLRHDRPTDVLSFRYDGEPIVGDILIAPAQARAYARRHGVPYAEELARYVVHGLLHWLGQEDRTAAERRRMRLMEDRVLVQCASR